MWFVDIITDLAWFTEKKGKLGEARSRATQVIPATDIENSFLLYGDDLNIRHLRVLIHTDQREPPHDLVNASIQRWINLLEVASGLTAANTATSASLGPNTSGTLVFLGEGGEDAESCQLDPQYGPAVPLNYDAAANLMATWQPDYSVHFFYLGRFLNHDLPAEVRWLNGYRVLEWHFRRGKAGLAADPAYRTFLDASGDRLDATLKPDQDRKGIMEEVRALAAHALLSRTTDPRLDNGSSNLILKTFPALEALVMAVMNAGAGDGVRFLPTPSATATHAEDRQSG